MQKDRNDSIPFSVHQEDSCIGSQKMALLGKSGTIRGVVSQTSMAFSPGMSSQGFPVLQPHCPISTITASQIGKTSLRRPGHGIKPLGLFRNGCSFPSNSILDRPVDKCFIFFRLESDSSLRFLPFCTRRRSLLISSIYFPNLLRFISFFPDKQKIA